MIDSQENRVSKELADIFERLATGEKVSLGERWQVIKLAITSAFSGQDILLPKKEEEQKNSWEFNVDYDAEKNARLDEKISIKDGSSSEIGRTGMHFLGGGVLKVFIYDTNKENRDTFLDAAAFFPDQESLSNMSPGAWSENRAFNLEEVKAVIDLLETDKFKLSIKFENVLYHEDLEDVLSEKIIKSFSAKIIVHKKIQ